MGKWTMVNGPNGHMDTMDYGPLPLTIVHGVHGVH